MAGLIGTKIWGPKYVIGGLLLWGLNGRINVTSNKNSLLTPLIIGKLAGPVWLVTTSRPIPTPILNLK